MRCAGRCVGARVRHPPEAVNSTSEDHANAISRIGDHAPGANHLRRTARGYRGEGRNPSRSSRGGRHGGGVGWVHSDETGLLISEKSDPLPVPKRASPIVTIPPATLHTGARM